MGLKCQKLRYKKSKKKIFLQFSKMGGTLNAKAGVCPNQRDIKPQEGKHQLVLNQDMNKVNKREDGVEIESQ